MLELRLRGMAIELDEHRGLRSMSVWIVLMTSFHYTPKINLFSYYGQYLALCMIQTIVLLLFTVYNYNNYCYR